MNSNHKETELPSCIFNQSITSTKIARPDKKPKKIRNALDMSIILSSSTKSCATIKSAPQRMYWRHLSVVYLLLLFYVLLF